MDARYPERYLHDRRLARLTDAEHRAYVLALVWSVANRTDGVIAVGDLDALPRAVNREALAGLERAELATEQLLDGDLVWLLTDYTETQSTRAELDSLDAARRAKRANAARVRAEKAAHGLSAVAFTTEDRQERGQDRQGKDRPSTKALSKDSQDSSWPVVSIPRAEPLPLAAGAEGEPF